MQVNVVVCTAWFPLWQTRRLVTDVRRAHGDPVSALHEAACEASDEPWYPPVRPGVRGVGRDVKDVQQPSLDDRLVIDL
jgi:hypothetical protein